MYTISVGISTQNSIKYSLEKFLKKILQKKNLEFYFNLRISGTKGELPLGFQMRIYEVLPWIMPRKRFWSILCKNCGENLWKLSVASPGKKSRKNPERRSEKKSKQSLEEYLQGFPVKAKEEFPEESLEFSCRKPKK